ncbi:3-deoxy-D-arabino-heptulosonate 7-phosphate synthase [Aquincola sp. MAHUQ-54]|uniref:3-deoxy-D-arabino-heptulosonate 7-phosphate synthase n=1 Tax=Aquincola agrisoli TaxID=3119538 RepID=A0AAW9QEU5_9BURK
MPPARPLCPIDVLRAVPRRYPVPALPASEDEARQAAPAAALAFAIEHARAAMAQQAAPPPALQALFIDALARMIRDALRPEGGDPAVQALVLRHHVPCVREHAALAAQADRDRRAIRSAVDAVAHPAKPRPEAPQPQRQALERLHALASSGAWQALAADVRGLLDAPVAWQQPGIGAGLQRILDAPALQRLQRLDALASDAAVRRHQGLQARQGPAAGTHAAAAHGADTRRRGAVAEAQAAPALQALVDRLNTTAPASARYRAVGSLLVPGRLAAHAERAKTEWDLAVLRQAPPVGDAPAWELCLLVEVKASADAATSDFPRLLRGLALLAGADAAAALPFASRQGELQLRGASLRALAAEADLHRAVLYCCDGPADPAPRLLSAASRMQLLSAPQSLAFAGRVADGQPADLQALVPLWRQLLASPRFEQVLRQYPTLCQVRALMVHVDDLSAAVGAGTDPARQ